MTQRHHPELSTTSFTSTGRWWLTEPFGTTRLLSLFICMCVMHTQFHVCAQRLSCVLAFDLLTHVFNWNSMQSAYCSTNRICTWWCQPKFFRHLPSVLRSHTVRQDHLARLPETPVETRNTTIISPVCLRCIHCYNSNHYIHLCWMELQQPSD